MCHGEFFVFFSRTSYTRVLNFLFDAKHSRISLFVSFFFFFCDTSFQSLDYSESHTQTLRLNEDEELAYSLFVFSECFIHSFSLSPVKTVRQRKSKKQQKQRSEKRNFADFYHFESFLVTRRGAHIQWKIIRWTIGWAASPHWIPTWINIPYNTKSPTMLCFYSERL